LIPLKVSKAADNGRVDNG